MLASTTALRFPWATATSLAFGVLLLQAHHGVATADDYEIIIDPREPAQAEATLILDGAPDGGFQLAARVLGSAQPPERLHCAELALAIEVDGNGYQVPPGCTRLSWPVEFRVIRAPDHNVSEQRNLMLPGHWWWLTEWGSLPRRANVPGRVCLIFETQIQCKPLPGAQQAPLFMVLGEPRFQLAAGGHQFRVFTGLLPESLDAGDLLRRMDGQLGWLARLAPASPRTLDVLWLGIDREHGVAGGAAGSDTFAANLVLTDGAADRRERIRLRWISAHELFHMLVPDVDSLWAAESLAHYYGYKSLAGEPFAKAIFADLTATAEDAPGLLAAQELVHQGQGQHYGLFYSKGAAFWHEIDQALLAAGGQSTGLDALLPLLTGGVFSADGALPPEFDERLREIIGDEQAEAILGRYLSGSQSPGNP